MFMCMACETSSILCALNFSLVISCASRDPFFFNFPRLLMLLRTLKDEREIEGEPQGQQGKERRHRNTRRQSQMNTI